jgi:hypothetical protein
MYKGNQRNFNGMILNIIGSDDSLEKMIDELEFMCGAEILSRRDMENGGMLVVQADKFAAPKIRELAKKLELAVGS